MTVAERVTASSSLTDLPRLGGRLSLDFVNTIDPLFGDRRIEYLHSYEALIAWAAWVNSITDATRAELLSKHQDDQPSGDRVLREAHELRIHLRELLRPSGPTDLALSTLVLNRHQRRANQQRRLVAVNGEFGWAWSPTATMDAPLLAVALDGVDILLSPSQRGRIRQCDGINCGWLFVDTSKSGRRRWCSMEICGNRAKARRFRAQAGVNANVSP